MRSTFHPKQAEHDKNKITKRFILLAALFIYTSVALASNPQQPKAVWYRYYDSKGVANVSTNVTPNHIRYGYEALDSNMQVIKRAKPYNTEQDLKQAPKRAIEAQRQAEDSKLKRAYTNSHVALQKKNESLKGLQKQIEFQQEQLKQLQTDRVMFVRQEREYIRKGKDVPKHLKDTLITNQKNLVDKKDSIQALQTRYRTVEADYDRIISRLKTLE